MKQVIRMKLPPEVEQATDDASYVGAFENIHGELLIYTFANGEAMVWHSDCDWQGFTVVDARVPGVLLDQSEIFFVAACWAATHEPEIKAAPMAKAH